jgi:hypothetical protein
VAAWLHALERGDVPIGSCDDTRTSDPSVKSVQVDHPIRDRVDIGTILVVHRRVERNPHDVDASDRCRRSVTNRRAPESRPPG